jgi:signal transduction histidine kinase
VTVATGGQLQDLREVIDAYNVLAERLQGSQQALQREVVRLREELAEKNRQIARKNRLEVLGEMAAGVAHEIRNPLGSIDLHAGLIAREASGDERVLVWARKIQRATRDLSHTVGEILDFTRPLRPRARSVVLDDIIASALDLASSSIQSANIAVRHLRADDLAVAGDFNLLQRAFLNVILNAVDAMPRGGVLTVSVRRAFLDGAVAVSADFADTGPGVPPQALSKVFDPFFTTKDSGTGLGLAMTGRIVAAHRGRVSVANAPGGGAVFTFVLPVDAAREEAVS